VTKKCLLTISMLVVAALVFSGFLPGQSVRSDKITVLNPGIASTMAKRLPLSPRLNSLEGKTIYLVDIGWGGPDAGYSVYEEMQAWFAQNMPSVKIVIKRKKGSYAQDDPDLWKEIAKNANAAMVGVSG